MTGDQCSGHFARHGASICAHIRQGTYIPFPERRVEMPKPNGGTGMPGIPTVQDRVIQQAIAQILTAHYDPTFSEYSYGFRTGRSAHDAIKQSTADLEGGCRFIVEIDLAKFFDTVNHDRLMSRLEKDCADKALLKRIRRAG